jgi:threonine dehydrogenase-like Zn-dependent dehydrogenase
MGMSPSLRPIRAAFYREPDRFVVEPTSVREPGPHEVAVSIAGCGICGTDLHYRSMGLMRTGHVPGHEIAGFVSALGRDVVGRKVGDLVAIEPLKSCGVCEYCSSGRDSICRDVGLYGIQLPGGLADRIVVPAKRTYALPEDLDPVLGALTEPVAVAVHGLRRGGLAPGERVLVLGSGAVGLVTLLAARHLGAKEIYASARYPQQAELARALGADHVLGESEASVAGLDDLGREVDFDLVVETVGGHANTLETACAAARPGGRISVVGVFMSHPALPPFPLLVKELSLHWSNCYHRTPGEPADFEQATVIVDHERDALSKLVTNRIPLDRADEAFTRAMDKDAGTIKVIVTP